MDHWDTDTVQVLNREEAVSDKTKLKQQPASEICRISLNIPEYLCPQCLKTTIIFIIDSSAAACFLADKMSEDFHTSHLSPKYQIQTSPFVQKTNQLRTNKNN